jgi:hypothetical protein
MATSVHPETWLRASELGHTYPPYQKTYDFTGEFIDADHRGLHENSFNGLLRGKIKGSLREADALKIYELAYFTSGPVLEVGTYHGLSASIIATALRNAGSPHRLTTVDLHKGLSDLAARNLTAAGLSELVTFDTSDGTRYLDGLIERGAQFGFAFIDHSHEYSHTKEAAERLSDLIIAGGYALFHDFNDPRNNEPTYKDYDVYQAVIDGLHSTAFAFAGVYGCTALYTRKS